MDQALRYFRDTNDFDSTVLIKIYKFIKEGINKNNFISEHDLMLAIQLLDTKSDEQFLNISISAYSSIILNTCMESFISASGTFLFKLHKNILSEDDFMNTISTSLRERFQPSIVKDLANKLDRYRKRSSLLTIQDRNIINNSKQRINAIEKSEPIVELMAKLRKLGMDMLFPLKAHDKVLACIFISASVLKKPVAHRELIDLVIDVKESSLFSDFEDVSKTKIRGLLALLKHSQILEPYLFEEDPVKLKLVDSIQSFTMLRKIHDKFLLS